jgi:hypothetical protein
MEEWFGSEAAGEVLFEPWVGFVPLALGKMLPGHLSNFYSNRSDVVLEAVLESDAFLQSAPSCVALFAFSKVLATAVSGTLAEMGIKNVAVCNVNHPVAMVEPSLLFDPVADLQLALSKRAAVVLLNQPYARVESLHKLQTRRRKILLQYSTNANASHIELLRNQSIAELQLELVPVDKRVQIKVAAEEQWNLMLRRNIIVVDTWAAAAVPSTLDALTFQAPFLIRKLPETIEYVGEDYPLFFTSLQGVQNLLNDEELLQQKMTDAHTYLKLLNSTHAYTVDAMAIEMMNCTTRAITPQPWPP